MYLMHESESYWKHLGLDFDEFCMRINGGTIHVLNGFNTDTTPEEFIEEILTKIIPGTEFSLRLVHFDRIVKNGDILVVSEKGTNLSKEAHIEFVKRYFPESCILIDQRKEVATSTNFGLFYVFKCETNSDILMRELDKNNDFQDIGTVTFVTEKGFYQWSTHFNITLESFVEDFKSKINKDEEFALSIENSTTKDLSMYKSGEYTLCSAATHSNFIKKFFNNHKCLSEKAYLVVNQASSNPVIQYFITGYDVVPKTNSETLMEKII